MVALAVLLLVFKLYVLAASAGILALFILYFFRDPERRSPGIDGAIVSPADGRVTAIEEIDHPAFPGGRARRVSTFLSIFSVHVNRSPITGCVQAIEYRPGRFLNAMSERSATQNERNRLQLRNGSYGVVVDQIAGAIARRIVCQCQVGDYLQRGERIGLIRFGSRCDTYFPLEAELHVKRGMKVLGGETVLAIMPPKG
jgi:phosphatidylserine decarboxylase